MTIGALDYLQRLSSLAVAFVGFSAVVVALRRALGAELSELHVYFVRLFIEGGLAVAALGLLPAALAFTGLGEATIWRVSSAAAALLFTAYLVILYRRRRRVTNGQFPARTWVDFALYLLPILGLWVNALGIGFTPGAALYALALTWLLVLGGWVFLQNIQGFVLGPQKR